MKNKLEPISSVSKKTVGLVQINSEFSGQVYFPLVAGYLESFFKTHSRFSEFVQFVSPIFKRDSVESISYKLRDCELVGFSVYVWNEQLSLAIAAEIKKNNPNVKIVFGGPQVPDNAESYLLQHDFIDLCVHNEGEIAFTEILENFILNQDLIVANTSTLIEDKTKGTKNYSKIPNRPRIKELDTIPSPFLNGYFDNLLREWPNQTFLALWESNRGCPFSCTFCDWGSSTASKVNQFGTERLLNEIEWIGSRKIPFVFVCDANFGLLPRDEEIATFVAQTKNKFGYPEAFSVQNTKNVKERAFRVQKILSDSGLGKGVTLSMQSLNPETLELIRRDNISLETYRELQENFMNAGVLTYSDLILGLPGETYESWILGINILMKNGQHNRIQFNNLSLLPNAEMFSEKQRELAGFETVKSQIVNVHGSKSELLNDVPEVQELVVGTKSMPKPDWVKARVFAWWVAFLYFDKLLQIPLVLLGTNKNYEPAFVIQDIVKHISSNQSFEILSSIHSQFTLKAQEIQKGDIEYVWDPNFLDVFWPADEYAYGRIVSEQNVDKFYLELTRILEFILGEGFDQQNLNMFLESIQLNKKLLILPNQTDMTESLSESDKKLLAQYVKLLNPHITQDKIKISQDLETKKLSFTEWQRKILWYGHRSGNYLKQFHKILEDGPRDYMSQIPGHY